ncbi:MAG TPA: serine/threonine protein kinase [Cyanobacteria bacterium UBA8803]|nr:serine/threonine protein kinase [Cyanobacteria bacterium UBA9273]HBL59950.1 serine/threonine protein kinase [Cyanobacteria bacterium UBA8803]
MMTIPGYYITEQLYSGLRTQVYRGIAETDKTPVVIKLLKEEYPTFNELVQFRNQYTIAQNLNLPGIVKHLKLENYRHGFALVMEDFGGISLHQELKRWGDGGMGENSHSLKEFLAIAIQIVTVLEGLYRNRVIHKDIKPHNILINPQTREVKIIDFSIASLLPRENQEITNPNTLEGTLAYISPEQTGRMNRAIDYRTDFYSLGVTFYELLTGQLPFVSADPMELVHCHIARQPAPAIAINPAIPQVLNDIVMKLMAKTAEERYQTAFGLKQDLQRCLTDYSATNSIAPFELGSRDISERFAIPEKLYGRETEVATLLAAFDRVSAGSTEMMLVAGFSGIGKTAAVNEVHKPIVRQRGYFIKGKFDQFKRDIPFSALVQAFQNLMRQLCTESATAVQKWQAKILAALGDNGQVIIDVIPELELLIGKQPPVPELEGSAAQNRFNLLFQKFIRIFTNVEHPLVIFLDDLQWADSASLNLMKLLMSETSSGYLLLIGAYRDNEVSAAHPLMRILDEIKKTKATVNQIILTPLDRTSLNCLIADTLSCPLERAIPLTEIVLTKTKGNPFFTNQFLKALHEAELISFDFNSGYWQCDIANVRAIAASDDVVEFMATQLQKLPATTQTVLKLAACIGNQFDLATLAIVYEKSPAETAAELWQALQEGLIIPVNEIYKFFQSPLPSTSVTKSAATVPYKFLHDRVQQAAYSLIPESQKQSTHLKIGQLLLSTTPLEQQEEKIFDIVNQLNMGAKLINQQTQRDELVQLNLRAGRKALAATASAAAKQYLTVGIELLVPDSWQTQYELTLELYSRAAEAAYLSTDFEQMEKWATVVLQQAKTLLDRVKVYEVKIQTCMAQGKQLEAVRIGLQVLELLGVNLPESPTPLDIQQGLAETAAALAGKAIADLINLPPMTDACKLAAMHMLSSLFSPIYVAAPALLPLIPCQQVNLSIAYGNSPFSAFGYANYAAILNAIVQDIPQAYQFGQLALNLVAGLNTKEIKSKTLDQVAAFTLHWQTHLKETFPLLQQAYQSGVENGDLEFASYSAMNWCHYSYFSGLELTALEREITTYNQALAHLKQEAVLNYNQIFHQAVLNLIFSTKNPGCLLGEAYNEAEMFPLHQTANDRLGLHYFYLQKLILSYLFGDYPQARENATQGVLYLDGATGLFSGTVFHLYDSLTALALYPDVDKSEQDALLDRVSQNQEKMRKWADHAPMNHLHKFYLVEAERHRVLGSYIEAMTYYDRAITTAKENGYINEEALAEELAAKFYLTWGKEKIGQVYLTDAYYAYVRWGATAKVKDLGERYPQLLAPILDQEKNLHPGQRIVTTIEGTVTATTTTSAQFLDLATVIKASQALSEEIHLDKLLANLMQVAIANTGAEKLYLLMPEDGRWIVEAQCIDQQSQLPFSPVPYSQAIPLSLINYVERTQETLVINDATMQTTFAADPYIIQNQPKSVLCTPIIHQGNLMGILYLENNLIAGAFTSARLEVLKILSSQAAISIENARLYQTLEDKVAERTAQLAQANEEIIALNERLKAENLRLSAELEVTRQLQQMILPKPAELEAIEGLEIAGFMEPADEVGGDYYDVLPQNGKVKISIGDVTGHGLESGVLMLMTQTAVRTLQECNVTDPVQFLDVLNRTIYHNIDRMKSDKNLTLALLDYCGGVLSLSGQHEEMIVVRAAGEIERIDTIDLGFPIGLDEEIAHFIAQEKVQLHPGDIGVLYTDGITEAENLDGEYYGLERLTQVVKLHRLGSAAEIKDAVISDVRRHIGSQKVFDDITLLVIKQK